jgi:hypothetical protein
MVQETWPIQRLGSDNEERIERREDAMEPLTVAAQFIAYTWFSRQKAAGKEVDPVHLAREKWPTFLPYATEGLGRLLIKIGRPRKNRVRA